MQCPAPLHVNSSIITPAAVCTRVIDYLRIHYKTLYSILLVMLVDIYSDI